MRPELCIWNGQRRVARLYAVLAAIALPSCIGSAPDELASSEVAPAAQATGLGERCDQVSAGTKLMELGHTSRVGELKQSGQRLASRDASGWRLWDRATGETITRGRGTPSDRIDLTGETLLTTESGSLQIRSAVDGALKQTIPYTDKLGNAKLSHDGSYVYALGELGITVWDLAGKQLAQAALDKNERRLHAAPGELRIARAQSKQIEFVSLETGETRTAGAFEGEFADWFNDGGHFVTFQAQPGEFLVYTKDVQLVQRLPWPHSTRSHLRAGGAGKNIWLYSLGTAGQWLEIYRLGRTVPALSYATPNTAAPMVAQRSAVIGISQDKGLTLIDLAGDAPKAITFSAKVRTPEDVSVDAEGHIVIASGSNIYAGSLLSTDPVRSFGCGAVLGLAGWRDRLAVSSDSGAVRLFSFRSGVPVLRWKLTDAYASTIEFMGDGRYLLVRGEFVDPATMRRTWATRVFEFNENEQLMRSDRIDEASPINTNVQTSVATNAPVYALTRCESPDLSRRRCDVFVRTMDGSEWRKPYSARAVLGTAQLSPGGGRLTVPDWGGDADHIITGIYDGWTRTRGLSELRVDLWLTDDRMVATDVTSSQQTAKIIDLGGATQTTLALPPLGRLRKGSEGVFHDADNVYRDADGQVLWSRRRATRRTPTPDAAPTTVAGRFVFVDDGALFAEPYASTPIARTDESISPAARAD
jgi:hypothetical protein